MLINYTGKPMRFAHTGLTQTAPENTLDSFIEAAKYGCEGIELDINLAGDGEVMVIHNKSLGYMTLEKNDSRLMDMTAEQIKQVDIPYRDALKKMYPPIPWTEHDGGLRIPCAKDNPENRITHLITFAEFDKWFAESGYDMTIEIEFKVPGMLDRMDEILATSPNVSKYIFFSGEKEVLAEMQEHYRQKGKPEGLRLGANIRYINDETMEFVRNSDLWEVGLNNEAFTKEDVDMLAEMGIKVFSNLGDYVQWWELLEPMGVTGFKTNYPQAYTEWWESTQK